MKLTKKTTLPVRSYFGLAVKDKERSLKAEDVTAGQKCCSHVHHKGRNASTLLSHLKCTTSHEFVKFE